MLVMAEHINVQRAISLVNQMQISILTSQVVILYINSGADF